MATRRDRDQGIPGDRCPDCDVRLSARGVCPDCERLPRVGDVIWCEWADGYGVDAARVVDHWDDGEGFVLGAGIGNADLHDVVWGYVR